MDIIDYVKDIGSFVSSITTITVFIALLYKKPRNWIAQKIRKDSELEKDKKLIKELSGTVANQNKKIIGIEEEMEYTKNQITDFIDIIQNFIEEQKNYNEVMKEKQKINELADQATIRNRITHTYQKYYTAKKMPVYEKENLMLMYKIYKDLGGNTYIESITEEMKKWGTLM